MLLSYKFSCKFFFVCVSWNVSRRSMSFLFCPEEFCVHAVLDFFVLILSVNYQWTYYRLKSYFDTCDFLLYNFV